jgi:hypothetical protein
VEEMKAKVVMRLNVRAAWGGRVTGGAGEEVG